MHPETVASGDALENLDELGKGKRIKKNSKFGCTPFAKLDYAKKEKKVIGDYKVPGTKKATKVKLFESKDSIANYIRSQLTDPRDNVNDIDALSCFLDKR